MNTLHDMYNRTNDKFSRTNRLVAEMAAVKELLEEAIKIDDTLGIYTYSSRLSVIEQEYKDRVIKTSKRKNQYSLND